MKKMVTYLVWIVGALFLVTLASPVVVPAAKDTKRMVKPEEQTIEGAERKTRGAGEDENIKNRSVKNEMSAETVPPPPPEGGAKARGAWCYLHVTNRTPWKIQIFVDGSYVGLVSPFGTANGTYPSGTRAFYGLAEFNNASDVTWGPSSTYCNGSYTWNLTYKRLGYY